MVIKGYSAFPQSSSITGTSPSDCLVSYPGHSFGGGVLLLCRGAVGVFDSPSWLGEHKLKRSLNLKRSGCSRYDTNIQALVREFWGNVGYLSIAITPRSTLIWNDPFIMSFAKLSRMTISHKFPFILHFILISFICLTIYQLLMGYLTPKFDYFIYSLYFQRSIAISFFHHLFCL